jgi:hypothetical protein
MYNTTTSKRLQYGIDSLEAIGGVGEAQNGHW